MEGQRERRLRLEAALDARVAWVVPWEGLRVCSIGGPPWRGSRGASQCFIPPCHQTPALKHEVHAGGAGAGAPTRGGLKGPAASTGHGGQGEDRVSVHASLTPALPRAHEVSREQNQL